MTRSVYIFLLSLFSFVHAFGQQDVGISSIISPASGCNVGDVTMPMNVVVRNYSPFPISPNQITVRYQVNGGPIVSQLITTFLLGNASFNFTFSQTQNLSACSQWNIKVWTFFAPDPNNLNDTLNSIFVNDCTPIPGTFTGPALVCDGNDFDSIQVVGGTFSYGLEWYSQVLPSGFIPTGITTDKIYLNNLTSPTNYNILYPGGLCPDVTSSTFSVGISPALNTGTTSADLQVCADNVVGDISLSGFSSVLTDWEESTDGGATWTSTGSNTNPYSISSYTDTTFFRALVSSGGCGSDYSDTIQLSIEPIIIPGTISGATNVCEGINSGSLILVGNSNSISTEWYTSTDNIVFTPTGNSTNTISYTNLTQTTYYKVISVCTICPNDETPVVAVTVDPTINLGTNSSDLNLCSTSISGSVSVSGFASTLTQWQQSTNGGTTWTNTGSNANPFDISGATTTTHYRAIIESGICGSDTTAPIIVTIDNSIIPGTISGGTTVCEGANSGTLNLSGNANQTSFEWYSSTDNVVFNPTGVSTASFPYTNLTQTTYYKVILQSSICPDDETNVITINVDPALNLGSTSSDLILCSSNITGTISNTGAVNLIVWEQSNNGGTTWTGTGSNATPYDISYITSSALFRGFISSGTCGSSYSDTISVTIEPAIIIGSISGATTVCEGANAGTLTLSGNSNQIGLQWLSSTDNITFSPTGITTATYNYSNLTQTTYFKVLLQGNICTDEETSVVTITVDPAINIGTPSPDQTFCSNNVIGDISLSGVSATINDWQESINGGVSWTSTGSNSNPYSINGITTTTLYRAVVESGACGTAVSDTITITIEPTILSGSISGGTTVCSGANSGILTLSGNANDSGFEWFISTNNITFSPSGVTTSTFNYTNITQTTYYKVVLSGNNCPNVETGVITIFVDPQADAGTPSPNLLLCESNVIGDVYLTGITASISDWEVSINGGTSWSSVGSNSNPLSINGTTVTSLFRAIVQSGTCPTVTSSIITVTIEPDVVPGNILGATTVCAGSNSGILDLVGNSNDFGFEWFSSLDNVTFTGTGVNTSSFNYSNVTQTTYYKVILQGNICSNTETPVVSVTIDPVLNLGSISPDLFLCETSISGNVTVSGAVTLFDWEQSNDNGITWFSTSDNSTSHDISGLTSSALFRALITSGSCGSGYSDTISVTIDPTIVPGTIIGANSVCATSNSGTLTLSGNQFDFGYQWYESTDNVTFVPTGNTGPTLNYNNLTVDTYYKVILLGDNCPDSETPVVVITVDPALNLGTISSDLILCANSISGFVTLTNAVTLMDWEQSNDNGITWNSTFDNSASHDISSISASALFRGFIDAGACGNGYSDTISVTIEDVIVPGSISGTATVCQGSNSGTLTLSGNANDFGYQWHSSTDNITFTPTGITTNTYAYLDLTVTTYFKVILLGNICSDDETNVITITVDPALNLGSTSSDLTLCADNITGAVVLTGSTVLQDWEQSNDNGATWFSTLDNNASHDISSITGSALFRALVSSGACGSGYSDTISVTIEPVIIPGSITGATTVCSGANAGVLSLSGFSNQISYEWYSSEDSVVWTPTGINTSTFNYTNLTQTTYFMVIHQGNICSNVQTSAITITVDPPLNLGVPSPDLILCESNITGAVTINGAVTLQDWEISFDNGLSFGSLGDNSASYDISGLTASALFRAYISSGTCGAGYSDTISVTIDLVGIPAVISSDFTICLGSTDSAEVIVLSHNGTIQSWQTSVNATSWSNTGTSDSTLLITSLFQTTQYQLMTTHGACPSVTSNTVTGVTAPLPTANAGIDESVIIGNGVQLNGSGGVFGVWTPPIYLTDPNSTSPLCTPSVTTTYAYTVIDVNGCTNTDYMVVTVDSVPSKIPSDELQVYNILTLNGDGINDVLIIEGLDKLENNKVLVFNGNGTLIYSSEDYQNNWDGTQNGKPVPDGVYLYAIEVSRITKYRGFITILNGE